MSTYFQNVAPGVCFSQMVPNRASDAGPEDLQSDWDARDWLYEARLQVKCAESAYRDDPKVQRRLRLEAIDLAIDALKCARELVEVE